MNARVPFQLALLCSVAASNYSGAAGNLVLNGGFEAGNLSGWTLAGSPTDTFVSLGFPHSGNYGLVFGSAETPGWISQVLPTEAGQVYHLSFWVSSGETGGGTPNELTVTWDGTALWQRTNMVQPVWTNLQFEVTASSDQAVLAFGGWDDPDYILLDDVSVVPPEPVDLRLQAATTPAGLLLLAWQAAVNRTYQVQYKLDLSDHDWVDAGGLIIATNTTLSVTEQVGPGPRRFYRVVLLP